jgi:phytoene dehydrogenase-like protein
MDVDAVVIGAGPNGLVAAIDLADHGWDVLVLEAQPEPGGAVRSSEFVEPGFVSDRFSAFYPLGAVSPHLRRLGLDRHGLVWSHAPAVLAHPTPDGPAAILSRDIDVTAASLDRFHAGDGDAWRQRQAEWDRLGDVIVDAVMSPFPPLRHAARLLARTRVRETAELARTSLLTTRRLSHEWFGGDGGALLMTGSALHADFTPDTATGGFFGWLLTAIGQSHGWPVPRGGAGRLTGALVGRLGVAGGRIRCGDPVVRIETVHGRAAAVTTASGERVRARRGVLADVDAPQLFDALLDTRDVPSRVSAGMTRYQQGLATFKVNWTLSGPIPWTDRDLSTAGTVHLADSLDELTISAAQIAMHQLPAAPFVLLGQMTTADPTRSPPGTESAWAYTSLPQRLRADAAGEIDDVESPNGCERFTDRIEQRIERYAPGFRSLVRRRVIQSPASMERDDANLVNGDKSLGSAQIHQQLVFRPTIGLGRAETPIDGLFLASASAHPGGGVHGACGANAARAAIAADARRRWRDRVTRGLTSRPTPTPV